MPTGYTAELMEKGMDFKKFILMCARAFGACIEMRDDPMDAPIPDAFQPSNYHVEAIANAKQELQVMENLDAVQRRAMGVLRIGSQVDSYQRSLEQNRQQNARLEAMEREVEAWEPPSKDHENLKSFMLEQIRISKHDLSYSEKRLAEIKAQDPDEFVPNTITELKRSIAYHEREHEEEVARANGRTNWVRQLKESIHNSQSA